MFKLNFYLSPGMAVICMLAVCTYVFLFVSCYVVDDTMAQLSEAKVSANPFLVYVIVSSTWKSSHAEC